MKPFVIVLIVLCVAGCELRVKKNARTDTPTSGIAIIASDDCLSNIVQDAINVFEASNKAASLLPIYTSENEAINLLLRDSIRLAIIARELTAQEIQHIRRSNDQLLPRVQKLAIDGIAIIVHRDNPDTLISIETLKKIMTGEIVSWRAINSSAKQDKISVVFDNMNSSTVRFIRDSVCKGSILSERLYSMQDNPAVIDYVARTPNAMGIIGVNWISNPNDSLNFNPKIRAMSVSREHPATAANAYKPFPACLYLRYYPLTRDVFLALTDLRGTLPAGFAHFMLGDRGQRIILKSGLVPATRPLRIIQIKQQ